MNSKLSSVTALVLSFVGCSPAAGGECTYEKAAGVCTFVTVAKADAGSQTTFRFTPDGGAPVMVTNQLTLTGGATPSAACVAANHLEANSELSCTRSIEITGTCTPLIFELPGFDQTASGCP